MMVRGVCIVGS